MSTEMKDKMTKALKAAIQAEIEGHHFYSMAARATQDEKGMRVFERFAAEELQHAQFLKSQYQAIMATGHADATATLGALPELPTKSPIFSDGIRARLGQAHYEMTALSVAIQLELNAIRHYQQMAQETVEGALKQFFGELAKWESRHYEALLCQQQELQEDYWSENSFAPF